MVIDLAVILLPAIGEQEAARMLLRHATPLAVAVRVVASARRRHVEDNFLFDEPVHQT